MKARVAVVFALSLVMSIPGIAQTCSSTDGTNALICSVPQLFGPGGMTLPNPSHRAHFAQTSINTLRPVNVSIGEELATLPLGSSGSGTTFTTDAEGHLVATQDSLGPILTERANVIGRKAFSIGFAYQYFSFDKIDGVNLKNFPAVLIHSTEPGEVLKPDSFKHDYVITTNDAHLSLNQTVLYGVFGISNRMDASIELPIEQVHFHITSAARIVRTQPCENQMGPNGVGGNCLPPKYDDPINPKGFCGEFHWFANTTTDCAAIFSSVTQAYPGSSHTDVAGVGDIILRGKYEVLRPEKYTGSLGMSFRFPTGDAKNFLGSGAYGVAPFAAFTYHARFSPHARIGYQWNGRSILAGDPTGTSGGATSGLPHSIFYSAGADYRATKRLTLAADLIGDHLRDASRLILTTQNLYISDSGKTGDVPTIGSSIESYNSDAIAVGAKVRLARELVLIGNITTRINDGGLRSNVVPLVGLSYSFAR